MLILQYDDVQEPQRVVCSRTPKSQPSMFATSGAFPTSLLSRRLWLGHKLRLLYFRVKKRLTIFLPSLVLFYPWISVYKGASQNSRIDLNQAHFHQLTILPISKVQLSALSWMLMLVKNTSNQTSDRIQLTLTRTRRQWLIYVAESESPPVSCRMQLSLFAVYYSRCFHYIAILAVFRVLFAELPDLIVFTYWVHRI